MHLKTNDIVEIISGDDRGLRGKILVIDREAGKVVVEGMNRVYKHVRRSQKNPQGGRLNKEMPIQMVLDFTRDVTELEGVEFIDEELEGNENVEEELESVA